MGCIRVLWISIDRLRGRWLRGLELHVTDEVPVCSAHVQEIGISE
jgi:hypothetical protein